MLSSVLCLLTWGRSLLVPRKLLFSVLDVVQFALPCDFEGARPAGCSLSSLGVSRDALTRNLSSCPVCSGILSLSEVRLCSRPWLASPVSLSLSLSLSLQSSFEASPSALSRPGVRHLHCSAPAYSISFWFFLSICISLLCPAVVTRYPFFH